MCKFVLERVGTFIVTIDKFLIKINDIFDMENLNKII